MNLACVRCAHLRRQCDKKNPCAECARLGRDCVPQANGPCPACGRKISSKKMRAIRHSQTDGSQGQTALHMPKEIEGDDAKNAVKKLDQCARDPSFVRSLDDDQLQQLFRTWEAIIREFINCEQATGKPS